MADLDRRVTVRFTRPAQPPAAFPSGYTVPSDATYNPEIWPVLDEDRIKVYGPWDTSGGNLYIDNRGATSVFRLDRDDYDIPTGRIPQAWPIALHWVDSTGADQGTVVYYSGALLADANGELGFYLTRDPRDEDSRQDFAYSATATSTFLTATPKSITVTPYIIAMPVGQSVEWAKALGEGLGADSIRISADNTAEIKVVYRTFQIRRWANVTDTLTQVVDSDGLTWDVVGWEELGRERFTSISCQRTL